MTLGVILYIILLYIIIIYIYIYIYLYYYYYILYYTLPPSQSPIPSFLPFLSFLLPIYLLFSSFPSSDLSSLLSFPSHSFPSSSHSPLLFSPLSQSISSSFILYVSVLTYPYLYSITSSQSSDPACFIGVDG